MKTSEITKATCKCGNVEWEMGMKLFKDTLREIVPSNPAFTKSMNMDIWVVSTSNQLFVKASCTEIKFSKK